MAMQFPIMFEREASGVISAYVAGLPVYAQGATRAQAERAIRDTLSAYLETHPAVMPTVDVKVATVEDAKVRAIVSPAALLGRQTSRRKAASSRANGRLGGRPRTRA